MTIAPRDAASICKWGLALALATLTFADAQAARLLNPSPPMPASLRTQTKAAALNAYATNIATQQYVMVVQGTKDWDGAGNDYVVVNASATYYDLATGADQNTSVLGTSGIVKVPVGKTQQIDISTICSCSSPGPGQGRIVNAIVYGPISNYQLASDFTDQLGKSWVLATTTQQATLYPTFVSITVGSVAYNATGAHVNGSVLMRLSRTLTTNESLVVLVSAPAVSGQPSVSKLVPVNAQLGGLSYAASYTIDLPAAYVQAYGNQVKDQRLALTAEAQLVVNGGPPQSFASAQSRAQAAISFANRLACTATSNPLRPIAGTPVTLSVACQGNYSTLGYTWTDSSGATVGTGPSISVIASAAGNQTYTVSVSDPTTSTFAPAYSLSVAVVVQAAPADVAAQAQSIVTPAVVTAVNAPTIQMSNVRQRLDELRMAHSPASAQALHVTFDGQGLPPLSALALGARDNDGKLQRGGGASADKPDAFEHWGVFLNGNVDIGRQSAVDTQQGFRVRTYGVTGGLDYRFDNNNVLGLALGWLKADTDLNNSAGNQDAHGFADSLFGSYVPAENAYIDGILNFGHNSYDSSRSLRTGGNASSSTSGNQFGLSVSAGWNFYDGGITLNPYGRIEYVDAKVNGFTESGPDEQALTIGQTKVRQTTLALGAQVSYAISTSWGVLIPNGRLEWIYLAQNDISGVTAQLVAIPGSATTVTGPGQNRNYGSGTAGIQALFGPGVSAFFNYEASFGRGSYSNQQYTLGVRVEF